MYSDEDDFVTNAYFSGKYNFVNKKEYKIDDFEYERTVTGVALIVRY